MGGKTFCQQHEARLTSACLSVLLLLLLLSLFVVYRPAGCCKGCFSLGLFRCNGTGCRCCRCLGYWWLEAPGTASVLLLVLLMLPVLPLDAALASRQELGSCCMTWVGILSLVDCKGFTLFLFFFTGMCSHRLPPGWGQPEGLSRGSVFPDILDALWIASCL